MHIICGLLLLFQSSSAGDRLLAAAGEGNFTEVQAVLNELQQRVDATIQAIIKGGGQHAVAQSITAVMQKKAALDARDNASRTPLMLAASQGDFYIVNALIRAGADTSLKSSEGITAATIAIEAGYPEVASFIEEAR